MDDSVINSVRTKPKVLQTAWQELPTSGSSYCTCEANLHYRSFRLVRLNTVPIHCIATSQQPSACDRLDTCLPADNSFARTRLQMTGRIAEEHCSQRCNDLHQLTARLTHLLICSTNPQLCTMEPSYTPHHSLEKNTSGRSRLGFRPLNGTESHTRCYQQPRYIEKCTTPTRQLGKRREITYLCVFRDVFSS